MTVVTLARCQIRRIRGHRSHSLLRRTVILIMVMSWSAHCYTARRHGSSSFYSRFCQVNGYLPVHALVNRILVQSEKMVIMSVVPRRRSTFLRRRSMVGLARFRETLCSYLPKLTNTHQGFPIGTMGSVQRRSILWLAPLLLTISQAGYKWLNTTDNLKIYDPQVTVLNPYHGGMCSFFMTNCTYQLRRRGISTDH
jgi:hypothetical protein